MNTINTSLSELESDLNYNIHKIVKNFLQIDNDNNNNLYLLDLNQLKSGKLVNPNENNINLLELIHTNISNITEIVYKHNLLITLGINNNKNIFHFWEINNDEEITINLINYLEVVYHQINKFYITDDLKSLICYCLDNTIQKLDINSGQLEKIFNINHWIFNSLPNYILDDNRIIYCTHEPKLINIKENKIDTLKLDNMSHIKKINYVNNNIYLLTLDQKIYQLNNNFELKYVYYLSDYSNGNEFEFDIYNKFNNGNVGDDDEIDIIGNIENWNYIDRNNTKLLKIGNQIYSNINFISSYDNNKYLLVNHNNTILKLRNKNCYFSIKNIDLFNKKEKQKIIFVIWLFRKIEYQIKNYIPLEMIEHIFSFTTLGDWSN